MSAAESAWLHPPHIGGRPWRGWMLLCFFLRAEESKKYYQQGNALQKICLTLKNITFMIKWNTVKKILQIVATVITTILGTNIIQSCMNI